MILIILAQKKKNRMGTISKANYQKANHFVVRQRNVNRADIKKAFSAFLEGVFKGVIHGCCILLRKT